MPRLRLPPEQIEIWPRPNLDDKTKLCAEIWARGDWIAHRDAALVATIAAFGKRSGECSSVKLSDIRTDDERLFVLFHLTKTAVPSKLKCSQCGALNRSRWKFCALCGSSLENAALIPPNRVMIARQKSRLLTYPLCRFIIDWAVELQKFKPKDNTQQTQDIYLFPVASSRGFESIYSEPVLSQHVRRTRAWDVIHKHRPTWWAHLLRHSLATAFSEDGADEKDLMDWFDWSRYETAHRYIQLGGGKRIKEMGKRNV
jgi:integrase